MARPKLITRLRQSKLIHEDWQLYPVFHLGVLERKLSGLRQVTVSSFWLSARAPHHPITAHTMSRWLAEVIRGAGTSMGVAREVRSVGATVAVQANLDIKQILKAGNWQRLSTLQRHYFRPQGLPSLTNILRIVQWLVFIFLPCCVSSFILNI